MWRYFELLSFRPLSELALLHRSVDQGRNPRDVKFELARELVARFHDPAAAERAQADFTARFAHKVLPEDLPELAVTAGPGEQDISLSAALAASGLVASGSEARRKIGEGAVRIDGEKVMDAALRLAIGASHILQMGPRRFARILVKKAQ
jgi:tyrosyl-tRNA synthetase